MSIDILQQRRVSLRKVISGTCLIAGTTIGAGMLGIPLVTADAGFFPAVTASLIVWAFMLITGLLYMEVALSLPPGANIMTMAGNYLGPKAKIASAGMFLFLYYCLLVAYISGGAPLLSFLLQSVLGVNLDSRLSLVLFGLVFGGIVGLGTRLVGRVNLILSVAMFLAYGMLISEGSSEVMLQKLIQAKWTGFCFALPVLFSAFGFHNVVPSLCIYLEQDRKSLKLSLFLGTALALVVYLIWQWLILGSLSLEAIKGSLEAGQPATFALQSLTGRSSLFAIGQSFAFFALVTSFLGVAFSVVDFLNDGMKLRGAKRPLLVLLTFLPPGLCAALNPALFETALGIAGGFGEAILNGVLPVALAWKYRNFAKERLIPHSSLLSTSLLIALLSFGIFVMGVEVMLLLK